jgi:hypothetical protein
MNNKCKLAGFFFNINVHVRHQKLFTAFSQDYLLFQLNGTLFPRGYL